MTHKPLISIITPCYNAEIFLKEAINSVLGQTYPHFELILVNDGSTDNTETIIRDYNDPRIRYFRQENKGQCVASNFGLSKALGEYIKFFDADDLMNDFHLESQLSRLNGCSDVMASCAWGRFYDNNPQSTKFIPEPVWQDLESIEWIKKSLSLKNDMMGACLWLIPRGLIEKTGGWDDRLSLNNDFEFSMRLLTHVKTIKFAENARIYYRSGNISLSGTTSERAYRAALLSTDLGCSYLLKKENSHFVRNLCANRYKEWLFRIFPEYPEIQREIETKIKNLGGSNRNMDGGMFFKFITKVIGWRNAKLLKIKFHLKGYKKLPWN
jgi:glycosyltransferase involved in cell wall biosynthesis